MKDGYFIPINVLDGIDRGIAVIDAMDRGNFFSKSINMQSKIKQCRRDFFNIFCSKLTNMHARLFGTLEYSIIKFEEKNPAYSLIRAYSFIR